MSAIDTRMEAPAKARLDNARLLLEATDGLKIELGSCLDDKTNDLLVECLRPMLKRL